MLAHLLVMCFAKIEQLPAQLLRLYGAYSIIQIGLYLQVNTLLVIYKSRYYSINLDFVCPVFRPLLYLTFIHTGLRNERHLETRLVP